MSETIRHSQFSAGNVLSPTEKKAVRKRWFVILGAAIFAVAFVSAAWWFFVGSRQVSTDDAYVEVSVAQVTPMTSGRVAEVRVSDSDHVKKGDILVVIDPEDAELAINQAEAGYQMTLRKIRTYYAAMEAREVDFDRTKLDYERRLRIMKSGAVSDEELSGVKAAYEAASAALNAAKALTDNTTIEKHPELLAVKAQLETARLNLRRTIVRAPVTGVIVQRSVQAGQMVGAGRPVMAVVPLADVHVVANFKENQLSEVHPGQPAQLTSDLYGSSVKFHGKVRGLGGGTGSAFAVIPAQNATGNWIKVVQRVPVRIDLDQGELERHPLRVGLSMNAAIDISN